MDIIRVQNVMKLKWFPPAYKLDVRIPWRTMVWNMVGNVWLEVRMEWNVGTHKEHTFTVMYHMKTTG